MPLLAHQVEPERGQFAAGSGCSVFRRCPDAGTRVAGGVRRAHCRRVHRATCRGAAAMNCRPIEERTEERGRVVSAGRRGSAVKSESAATRRALAVGSASTPALAAGRPAIHGDGGVGTDMGGAAGWEEGKRSRARSQSVRRPSTRLPRRAMIARAMIAPFCNSLALVAVAWRGLRALQHPCCHLRRSCWEACMLALP